MLALILKAAMDRVRIPRASRRPAFVYVDEAADYFDTSVVKLLTQARKYNVGCILAHQALEQMPDGLRDLVLAATSIKLAGGVSVKDAGRLAPELRTTPEFVLGQTKLAHGTQFASFVRSLTPAAGTLAVPFLSLEREPALADAEADAALAALRATVASTTTDADDITGGDASGTSDADDFSDRY
jgi:hypothetical protein